MANGLLQSLINRPDQQELVVHALRKALQHYHVLEDWDAQLFRVTSIPSEWTSCNDGVLSIDLSALTPRFNKLMSNTISIGGTTFTQAKCLGECNFVMLGSIITIPWLCSCVDKCTNTEACIEYLSMPDYTVSCEGVTGSWIYDKYPDVVDAYAYKYARSILDNTNFRWDEADDIDILRGEL